MATEIEKFAKVAESGDNQVISGFIDWLGAHGYWVSEYVKIEGFRDETLVPIRKSNEALLADYFDIDLAQLDREKRELLTQIQSEGVCRHDFPNEWDYTYNPAGSKTCRKGCGTTIHD